MRFTTLREPPPPSEDSDEQQDGNGLPDIIFNYKVLIGALIVLVLGILCLSYTASHATQGGHAGFWDHFLRDIGIALVTTAIVVIAADFYARKEFLSVIEEKIRPLKHEIFGVRRQIAEHAEPLRAGVDSLAAGLHRQFGDFDSALETKLRDLRACIALGDDLRALGLVKVYEERAKIRLVEMLRDAAPGSEIKLLGIVNSDLSLPDMQKLVEQKLLAGCHFKILCLDPESQFVGERLREEKQRLVRAKNAISTMTGHHKNFVEEMIDKLEGHAEGGSIDLRFYDAMPRYFVFSTGVTMVVGFYLGQTRGAHAPHFRLEVKPGGVCTGFMEHFDMLWEQSGKVTASADGSPS